MCKTLLGVHSQLASRLCEPIPIHVPVVAYVPMLIFRKISLIFSSSDCVEAPGANGIVCSVAILTVREADQGLIRHDISFKGKAPRLPAGSLCPVTPAVMDWADEVDQGCRWLM
jgi:hypothetical protein